MQTIGPVEQERLTRNPDRIFLGFGFDWLPLHSQRLYELAKIDYRRYTVSPMLLKLLGYKVTPAAGRRDRPALHPWGRAARTRALPAAAEF